MAWRCTSLLDIGAGTGSVAVPVASRIPRYLAVEQDPTSARALRNRGLSVLEATFPQPIAERFDMVVCSQTF
jgi:predicted RNA methylase